MNSSKEKLSKLFWNTTPRCSNDIPLLTEHWLLHTKDDYRKRIVVRQLAEKGYDIDYQVADAGEPPKAYDQLEQ